LYFFTGFVFSTRVNIPADGDSPPTADILRAFVLGTEKGL